MTLKVLESYNFPVGLLPKGAVSYDLDPATRKISAYLNGSCSFSLEGSYKFRYQSTISGIISRNRLRDLRGINVKILLIVSKWKGVQGLVASCGGGGFYCHGCCNC